MIINIMTIIQAIDKMAFKKVANNIQYQIKLGFLYRKHFIVNLKGDVNFSI